MKYLLPLLFVAILPNFAHAHPGSNRLVCKSSVNSGSAQKVELSIKRSNGKGWFAPEIEISLDQKSYLLTTPDEMNNYGTTYHNTPLKVISVTAEVPSDEENVNSGEFRVTAIPDSVKGYDIENRPVVWSLEAEKDECYDTNGSAKFQAILNGYLFIQSDGEDAVKRIDTQILDCELTYNSGMSC